MPVQVSDVQLRQRRIEPVHDGRVNNEHIWVRFYHGYDTNQGGEVLNRALNGDRRTWWAVEYRNRRLCCAHPMPTRKHQKRVLRIRAKNTVILCPFGDQRNENWGDASNERRLCRITQGLCHD